MTAPRSLIMTLPPFQGGVRHMATVMAGRLARAGHDVTIAYYASLAHAAELVAPSWRAILGKRPATGERRFIDGTPAIAVGCWLPELEFSLYRPSRNWNDLIRAHDRHVVVGGTVLLSNPLTALGRPHLVWCATTLEEDRLDRIAEWTPARRWLERGLVGPVQRRIERAVLSGPGTIASISRHTRGRFAALGKDPCGVPLLPIPIDTGRYVPADGEVAPGVVGFAGRLDDARKNLPLLLDAVARAAAIEPTVRLVLCGDAGDAGRLIARSALGDRVRCQGELDDEDMPAFFRGLDMLVIPSNLEGHAIIGIEAMASGVPVISTRCGGPEGYVVDGVNGYLTGHDAAEIADRIVALTRDRALRRRLAAGARRTAEVGYGPDAFDAALEPIWRSIWNESL